jgi:hypothetical protein
VFARYWLHNKGPAPLGHRPVTAYVESRTVDLAGPVSLRVTISAAGEASGAAELIAPGGVLTPGELRYHTGSDGYQVFDVLVELDAAISPGIYHLAVRVADGQGQMTEDVVTLRTGDPGPDLEASLETAAVTASPGGSAELRLRLASRSQDEIRGEAQLISPFGTWDMTRPWTLGFTLPPGGGSTLTYRVNVPSATRPMSAWLLVKVMAFGTVRYTPAVPLTIRDA